MAEFTVIFLPDNSSVTVAPGTPLLDAARQAGLRMQSPCGGQGRCGKCLVQAATGVDDPTPVETRVLSPARLNDGWRLACQTRVVGDALVTVPESSLAIEHRIMVDGAQREVLVEPNVRKLSLQLPAPSVEDPRSDLNRVMEALGEGALPPSRLEPLQDLPGILRAGGYQITAVLAGNRLAAVEAGDTTEEAYGLAVDVGTTTVVAYLCHLPTGAAVAVASDLNSQAQYGDDVISRIQAATGDAEDLRGLNQAIIAVINDLVARTCHEAGVPPDAIYEVAVVGNTCMSHLLLGVSPAGLGTVPFVPSFRSAQTVRAADLGIDINPHGSVYVAPNIGSFVGADTVGVMLASELDRGDGLRIAVDIGTNGEIVVAKGGELYACSTAAGPAFEGAKISCGVRASHGAIDAVRIDDDVDCHVIGDVRPRGLCGSGLVDVIAELVRVGAVAETGRMLTRVEASALPEKVRERLSENEHGMEFVLARADEAYAGEPITLTARDVREMQLAKAAIYGGMELMLHQVGAEPGDVEQLLLAGAFGNYIRRESALAIGLIPSVAAERIASIGNAAGVGARLMLCSLSERRRAQEIARSTRHVELSEREGFYDRFADAMMLRPLPAER
jgi:uncharacterized 2Fe-2S/4Fe-4S cluster protein (DUF4445 family)